MAASNVYVHATEDPFAEPEIETPPHDEGTYLTRGMASHSNPYFVLSASLLASIRVKSSTSDSIDFDADYDEGEVSSTSCVSLGQ